MRDFAKPQRGFSLVELMVAVTLGLLLIGAVISVFQGSRQSYHKTNGTSALTDSARFSTDFMNRALRSTGYIGCASAPNVTTTGATTPNVLFDFGNVVDGYDAVGTGTGGTITLASPPVTGDSTTSDWSPALPSNFSVTMTNPYTGVVTTQANGLQGLAVKNSDILAVHTTLQNAAGGTQFPSPVTAYGSGNITIASVAGLQVGQLVAESDCSKSVVFQIFSINASSNTISYGQVNPSSSSTGTTMGNSTGTLPDTFDYSQVFLPTTSIFYIGVGADGDGALFRGDLTLTSAGAYTLLANEIVPDVENMQILYGADPNTTHATTQYTTAANLGSTTAPVCILNFNGTASFNCVNSIQVSFLVASPLQTVQLPAAAATITMPNGTVITPPRDTRQRTVYQVTVALRNILP